MIRLLILGLIVVAMSLGVAEVAVASDTAGGGEADSYGGNADTSAVSSAVSNQGSIAEDIAGGGEGDSITNTLAVERVASNGETGSPEVDLNPEIVHVGDEITISGSGAPPDTELTITMKRKCTGDEGGCSDEDGGTETDGCSGGGSGSGGSGGSGCSGGGCGQGGDNGNQGRGRPMAELGTVRTDAFGNWTFKAVVPSQMMAGARARAGGGGKEGGGSSHGDGESCELLPMPTPAGTYEIIIAGDSFLVTSYLTVVDREAATTDEQTSTTDAIASQQPARSQVADTALLVDSPDTLPSTGFPLGLALLLALVALLNGAIASKMAVAHHR